MALQQLRSSTENKRPTASAMSDGQLAVNTNATNPGLFFKDADGDIRKVGPVFVGSTAPNASPASGGSTGHSVGEQWLDNSGGTYVLKIWDGTAWRSESGTFVDVNGDTMTGALLLDNAASASAPDLSFDGDANTGIYSPGADQVAVATGGTGRLFIDSSGRLLVGTSSSPTAGGGAIAKSVIQGNTSNSAGAGYLSLQRGQAAASISSGETLGLINFADSAGNDYAIIKGRTGAAGGSNDYPGELVFGTAADGASATTDRMVITSSGNVKLNGDSPFIYLSDNDNNWIRGSSGLNQIRFGTNNQERMRLDSSGRLLIGTTTAPDSGATKSVQVVNTSTATLSLGRNDATISAGNDIGAIRFWGNAGSSYQQCAEILAEADGTHANNDKPTRLVLSTTADGASLPTERMRIDSAGNVSIGATSADRPLHVRKDGAYAAKIGGEDGGDFAIEIGQHAAGSSPSLNATGTNASLIFRVDGNERGRFNSAGNFGVGENSPTNKLTVRNDGAAAAKIGGNGSGSYYMEIGQLGATSSPGFNATGTSASMLFQVNGSEQMRIDSSGRLLVGATSSSISSSKAEIAGTSNTSYLSLLNTSASDTDGNRYNKILFRGTQSGGEMSTLCSVQSAHDGNADDQKGRITFHTNDGSDGDGPTERMRIEFNGAIRAFSSSHLIGDFATTSGASSSQQALQVVRSRTAPVTGGSAVFRVYTNGDAKNTNGVFTTLSDERLKENIVDAGSQWEDIKAVRIRKWNFAEATGNQTHTQIGPVAQELELTSPGLVYDYPTTEDEVVLDKDGNEMSSSKGVHQSVLYMKAVKALQEAMERIETLEAKVAALEAG